MALQARVHPDPFHRKQHAGSRDREGLRISVNGEDKGVKATDTKTKRLWIQAFFGKTPPRNVIYGLDVVINASLLP
jgi:hypothetical protein